MGRNRKHSRSRSRDRIRKKDLYKRLEFLEREFSRSKQQSRRSRSSSRGTQNYRAESRTPSRCSSRYRSKTRSRSPSAIERTPRGSPMRGSVEPDLHVIEPPTTSRTTHEAVEHVDQPGHSPSLLLLDDDDLQILGEDPLLTSKNTIMLHKAICSRWEHLITHGLNEDDKKSMQSKYDFPENFPLLHPPLLIQRYYRLCLKPTGSGTPIMPIFKKAWVVA